MGSASGLGQGLLRVCARLWRSCRLGPLVEMLKGWITAPDTRSEANPFL